MGHCDMDKNSLYEILETLAQDTEGSVHKAIGMLMDAGRGNLANEANDILGQTGISLRTPVINDVAIENPEDIVEALKAQCDNEEIINSTTIFNEDYLPAIAGITYDDRIVYDYVKMVLFLMERDNVDYDSAVEYIDYNVLPTLECMDRPPIILYPPDCYIKKGE